MVSFYWFDYETFGTSALWDRPCQFAGIRTDLELKVMGDPMTLYCRQADDYLPHPAACRVTGISPQLATEKGLPETQFIERIVQEIGHPGTCSVGYNSIRFDDEFTRFTRFRNLQDPYEHEWKDGNSRWDLIDVVRLARALRPEGIEWPTNEDGSPSNRLEHLCQVNGIEHKQAHDAMSDVWATIDMARLIRSKQPRLFEYALSNRSKTKVAQILNTCERSPCLQISGKVAGTRHNLSAIVPLRLHPSDKNAMIVLDLHQDPRYLLELDADEIARRLYLSSEDRAHNDEPRPGLRTVRLNRCPVIVPLKALRAEDAERLEFNVQAVLQHAQWAQPLFEQSILNKIAQAMAPQWPNEKQTDVDGSLYSGAFLESSDKLKLRQIRDLDEQQLAQELAHRSSHFNDKRLSEMVWRYLARNYPHALSSEQRGRWNEHCHARLHDENSPWLSYQRYFQALDEINWSAEEASLKAQLRDYGEKLLAQTSPNSEPSH